VKVHDADAEQYGARAEDAVPVEATLVAKGAEPTRPEPSW
jgi:hypothetical protein